MAQPSGCKLKHRLSPLILIAYEPFLKPLFRKAALR
jgi:hypothetical protein